MGLQLIVTRASCDDSADLTRAHMRDVACVVSRSTSQRHPTACKHICCRAQGNGPSKSPRPAVSSLSSTFVLIESHDMYTSMGILQCSVKGSATACFRGMLQVTPTLKRKRRRARKHRETRSKIPPFTSARQWSVDIGGRISTFVFHRILYRRDSR